MITQIRPTLIGLSETEDQLNRVERLKNFYIRLIFGLYKFDQISEHRNKLNWLPIRLRRNIDILTLLCNILFNPHTSLYLEERFEFLCDSHSSLLILSEKFCVSDLCIHVSTLLLLFEFYLFSFFTFSYHYEFKLT